MQRVSQIWPRSWLHFKISNYKVVFCGQIKKAIARYQLTADDEALLRMLQEDAVQAQLACRSTFSQFADSRRLGSAPRARIVLPADIDNLFAGAESAQFHNFLAMFRTFHIAERIDKITFKKSYFYSPDECEDHVGLLISSQRTSKSCNMSRQIYERFGIRNRARFF